MIDIAFEACRLAILDKPILERIDFKLTSGQFLRLAGGNGQGKTQFLLAMLGINQQITGQHVVHYPKHQTCYIASTPFFMADDKVQDVVATLAYFYGCKRDDLIDIMVQLDLPYETYKHHQMAALSQGSQQKLVLLPLFLSGNQFFVLDELFTGLDKVTQGRVIARLVAIYKQGATVVLVEHQEAILDELGNYIEMEVYQCQDKRLSKVEGRT